MKLSFNQIKQIVSGAVSIEENNGLVRLHRFTKEQEELYNKTNSELYKRALCTAGVKLLFKTNSKSLFINLITSRGSERKYFSADVFIDGKYLDCIDNFSAIDFPKDYTKFEFPLGIFEKNFELGEGVKTVCVHLPWSVNTAICEIAIDDGAFVEGIKLPKKLLVYGDSITQGYDAMHTSQRYTAKLADMLDAEEYNKGIAGEKFSPKLSALKDSFTPDYITVAYGTNDWSGIDAKTFRENCKEFFSNLCGNYPETQIYAITPIWRKDLNEKKIFGPFLKVEEEIRNATEEFKNISVISGFDFVPEKEEYFADLRLHPNDKGFECYFRKLYDKLKSDMKSTTV